MNVITIQRKDFRLDFETETLNFCITIKDKRFYADNAANASLTVRLGGTETVVPFSSCTEKSSRYFKDGLGEGVVTRMSGFVADGNPRDLALECKIWVDSSSNVRCELIPIEENADLEHVSWPSFFRFPYLENAYSVLPIMQGNLLYNDVEQKVCGFEPSVFFERMGYMPFYGQLAQGAGYICIVDTPYDAGYYLCHEGKGDTRLGMRWLSSMRKLGYARKLRLTFVTDSDYNGLCKIYRAYAKEQGLLRTMKEKIAAKPKAERLVGAPIIHTGALYSVKPGTEYYDENDPSYNYRLQTFPQIAEALERLHGLGLEQAYLHLDGWGKAGYDNQHPDVLPPNEACGGAAEMAKLSDVCRRLNILFAIHDQYRDYYLDAETFDERNAIMDYNQNRIGECRWYGGEQKYLCTSLAKDYIKRNLDGLNRLGVRLDGVYLDVFSLIQLEECYDPEHRMTRKDNKEYREDCFRLVNSMDLISSSEEPIAWSVPHMELVHHAPYCFPIDEYPYELTPVPLFNLVFHDCIIVPWELGEEPWGNPKNKDARLYALLNGGMPYLDIHADEKELALVKEVCSFQKEVCFEELVRHEILDKNREKAYFESCAIEVDFNNRTYSITRSKKE